MEKKSYSMIPNASHVNFWTPERYGFDLGINQCGYEFCDPLHYWEGVRDVYVLHYVLSGCGTLLWNDVEYLLTPHMGFLISPGVPCRWTASENDPWEYRWVAFSGEKAWQIMRLCSINVRSPVFFYDKSDFIPERMRQIYEASEIPHVSNLIMVGYLNLLLAELIRNFPDSNIKSRDAGLKSINDAIRYMQVHYQENISVDKVAKIVGVNRSHLYKLFIRYTSCSPSEYILNLRLEHAGDLLKNDAMSISDVAFTSGFHDVYYFSRVFKERKGLSPTEYRKSMQKK